MRCGSVAPFERRGEALFEAALDADAEAWVGHFARQAMTYDYVYLQYRTRTRFLPRLLLREWSEALFSERRSLRTRLVGAMGPRAFEPPPPSAAGEPILRGLVRLHRALVFVTLRASDEASLSDALKAAEEGSGLPRLLARETLERDHARFFEVACRLLGSSDGSTRSRVFSHLLRTTLAPPRLSGPAEASPSGLPEDYSVFRRRFDAVLDRRPERRFASPTTARRALVDYLSSELLSFAEDAEVWPHVGDVMLLAARLARTDAGPALRDPVRALARRGSDTKASILSAQMVAAARRLERVLTR